MRILIVKLSSLGDIVHALPVLPQLRRQFPNASISWVAERRSAEILRANIELDDLIEVDTKSLRGIRLEKTLLEGNRQLRDLRRSKFDIALDLQGLLKSALIAKLSGAKIRIGFSPEALREPAARFLYTDTVDVAEQQHVIHKNLQLAGSAFGTTLDTQDLRFPIQTDPGHRLEANAILSAAGGPIAILNPAGGWVTKLWQASRFGELADKIWAFHGLVPVVVTGPGENDLAKAVLDNSRSGRTIAAEPSIKGFYELARRAEVYVGGDTGPTHIAHAAGAPIVGLFGPTEWWRNGSTDPDDICVSREDIGCRLSCHRRTCSNWICMDIEVDKVFDAVCQRLARRSAIEMLDETVEQVAVSR